MSCAVVTGQASVVAALLNRVCKYDLYIRVYFSYGRQRIECRTEGLLYNGTGTSVDG